MTIPTELAGNSFGMVFSYAFFVKAKHSLQLAHWLLAWAMVRQSKEAGYGLQVMLVVRSYASAEFSLIYGMGACLLQTLVQVGEVILLVNFRKFFKS